MQANQQSLFNQDQMSLPAPVMGQISPWQVRIDNAIPPHTDFVDSVRRFGVIQPIITATINEAGNDDRNKGIYVIQGRRRTLAARSVGIETLVERRYALEYWSQFDVLLLMLQRQQRANPAAEYLSAFRLLQQGATANQIHAVTGIESGQLKKLMQLGELHTDLLDAFKEGRVTVGQAFQCSRLSYEMQKRIVSEMKRGTRISDKMIKACKAERRNAAMSAILNSPMLAALHAEAKPVTMEDLAERLSVTVISQMLEELIGDPRFVHVSAIFSDSQLKKLRERHE